MLVGATVTMEIFTQLRLISAVKTNFLADVFKLPFEWCDIPNYSLVRLVVMKLSVVSSKLEELTSKSEKRIN
jgi:hypothetical protein